MKTHRLIALLVLAVLITGCEKEDSASTAPQSNQYSGAWKIVFAGTYVGSGTMNIGSDGKFSLNVILFAGSSSFTNTITGAVSAAGNMTADIYYSGEKIGTCSGKFSGSAGSGNYQTAQPSNGTWSATKQ